ncbi:cytadherence high molecular weight protein 1 isoform X3 [Centroberyx affinis]|uniref:cytadherence high molecular weight protein 1 isoform X3 n=1 Tax=Centroberyx affinis TaxID=166261 RepID=UPI003A5C3B0B
MGLIFSWFRGPREVGAPLLEVTTETQVTPTVEAPVVAPAEIEVQTEDTVVIATEVEQTHAVCEPETEVEVQVLAEEEEEEAVPEVQVEAAVTEAVCQPEPVTEAVAEPEAEAPISEPVSLPAAEAERVAEEPVTEAVAEAVEEAVIEAIPEPEEVTEVSPVAPAEVEEVKVEAEVLAEEVAPEVAVEPVEIAEDVPAPAVEIPVEPVSVPEPLAEEAEAPVAEVTEAPAQPVVDTVVDDFVITDSAPVVEAAMAESAVEQAPVVMTDALNALSESLDVTPAVPEPAPVPAAEIINETECGEEEVSLLGEREDTLPPDYRPSPEDLLAKEGIEAQLEIEAVKDAIDEQTSLDVLSEDLSAPQKDICDMPCQMQLTVEPVQLGAMEIPAEGTLNGHMVPEVSIEG